MSKVRHGIWIAALMLALSAPISRAEETSAQPGFFEQLVAQVIAVIVGEEPTAASMGPPSPAPELGELVPVGG